MTHDSMASLVAAWHLEQQERRPERRAEEQALQEQALCP